MIDVSIVEEPDGNKLTKEVKYKNIKPRQKTVINNYPYNRRVIFFKKKYIVYKIVDVSITFLS